MRGGPREELAHEQSQPRVDRDQIAGAVDPAQADQQPACQRPRRDQFPLGVGPPPPPGRGADEEDRPRQRVGEHPEALDPRQRAAAEGPAAVVSDDGVAHERRSVADEVGAVPRRHQYDEHGEAENGAQPHHIAPAVGDRDRDEARDKAEQAHRPLAHDRAGDTSVEADQRKRGVAGSPRDEQAVEGPPCPRRHHHVRLAVVTDREEADRRSEHERRHPARADAPRPGADREHRRDGRDR